MASLHSMLLTVKNLPLRLVYALQKAVPLSAHQRRKIRNACFARAGFLFKDLRAYQYWRLYPDSTMEEEQFPQPGQWERVFVRFYADEAAASGPAILYISHDQGGGTETHVRKIARLAEEGGARTFSLRSTWAKIKDTHPPLSDISDTRPPYIRIAPFEAPAGHQLVFDPATELSAIEEAISKLGITHIHLHHTLDMPDALMHLLPKLTEKLGIAYDFTAHDYFSICPRFSLFDEGIRAWCGEPSTDKCDLCVRSYGSVKGREIDVAGWRADSGRVLAGARRIFVPSNDVATRLTRYYPELTFTVRPHPEDAPDTIPATIEHRPDEPLRVVMLGAIAPYKGSQVMLDCAKYAKEKQLPISFTILGHTDIDPQLRALGNVHISGGYAPDDLQDLLSRGKFHIAWFCNVIPESYSYTLSETLRAGIYPLAFDIGAIGERIRELGWGSLLPLKDFRNPEAITSRMLGLQTTAAPGAKLREQFHEYSPFLARYYGLGE